MSTTNGLKIISGNSNPDFSYKIVRYAGRDLVSATIDKFPDGEIQVKIHDDVRGSDIFVIQSTCPPVNDNLVELLILIDCLKRASVERITAVVPYFGYARQDRKSEGRVPISAKLMANLITVAGADRVLTMDLHAEQIQGFFDIPVDNLFGNRVFLKYLRDTRSDLNDFVILAPDVGSSKRADFYSKSLKLPLAIIDKRRSSASEVNASALIGSVKDKNVLIPDDMIATGGTIVQAVQLAKEYGANEICIASTHPIFAGDALSKLSDVPIDKIFISDTIPFLEVEKYPQVKIISVSELFARAIEKIHHGGSVAELFRVK